MLEIPNLPGGIVGTLTGGLSNVNLGFYVVHNIMGHSCRAPRLKTLKRPWSGDEMPYPKKRIHLPVIWSPEDVACLVDAALSWPPSK